MPGSPYACINMALPKMCVSVERAPKLHEVADGVRRGRWTACGQNSVGRKRVNKFSFLRNGYWSYTLNGTLTLVLLSVPWYHVYLVHGTTEF